MSSFKAGGFLNPRLSRAVRNAAARKAARAARVAVSRSMPTAVVVRSRRAPPATRGFFGSARRSPRELKVVDTAEAVYIINTTGSITLINGIAQGSDFNNRIGRRSTMRSVLLQGVTRNTDSLTQAQLARILILWDSQPNGALPAMTDIFTAATATSPLNLNNRDRFRILAEWRDALGAYLDTAGAPPGFVTADVSRSVYIYKRFNLETTYDGTTAAIGDIQTGAMLLVTIGNEAAANGSHDLRASVRVRFTDQ